MEAHCRYFFRWFRLQQAIIKNVEASSVIKRRISFHHCKNRCRAMNLYPSNHWSTKKSLRTFGAFGDQHVGPQFNSITGTVPKPQNRRMKKWSQDLYKEWEEEMPNMYSKMTEPKLRPSTQIGMKSPQMTGGEAMDNWLMVNSCTWLMNRIPPKKNVVGLENRPDLRVDSVDWQNSKIRPGDNIKRV